MRDVAARALYEVKTIVARHPALMDPLARLRGHGVLVDPETEVVIEGYPRSANSFSVAAFEMAQGRKTRIAHHTHAPAHVLEAIRLRVPAIVLIRDPEDAVLEFMIVRPSLTAGQALRGYVRFYEPLLRHKHELVVGPFPEVTTDFGAVMRRLNELYGTSFTEFEHTPENQQSCFDAMECYWAGRVGEGARLERHVGRPSQVRERLKDELRDEYHVPGLARLGARARGLYRTFASPHVVVP